jgi:tRNA A-37 threonylcarbamoyl transferase component Bud32
MHEIKDTRRAQVRIGYDGKVYKKYLGPGAAERYANEVRMLRFLEAQSCPFVPRILEDHPEKLEIVTTNCGTVVDTIRREKMEQLYQSLEQYGVRHGDPFQRNITYDARAGRFCVIDFEFSENLQTGQGLKLEDIPFTSELP